MEHILPTAKSQRSYVFINKDGKLALDLRFDFASSFSEGLAFVTLNNASGYINKNGKLVIKLQEKSIGGSFSDGLAPIRSGDLWGYIDTTGKIVIKPQFALADNFSEGLALVWIAPNQAGYINKNGQIVIRLDPKYSLAKSSGFSDGLARIKIDGRVGYIDQTGSVVIKPRFSNGGMFSEGLSRVEIESEKGTRKIGFIDTKGHLVVSPQFNIDDFEHDSTDFSEGWVSVVEEHPQLANKRRWIYIDKTNTIKLTTSFFYAGKFIEGLAVVYDDVTNKWGYIDRNGGIKIKPQFELAGNFSEGYACVVVLNPPK